MTEFDWVKARWDCSLVNLFEALKREVEQDVATRKALRCAPNYEFSFSNNGGEFSVTVEGDRIYRVIHFSLDAKSILVRDEKDTALFRGIPTVNNEARCILKVGDRECERWQFRKKALESLFFEEPYLRAETKWNMQQ